jgi:hypothetical protein
MPAITVTHRQWQNKSVALRRHSENPSHRVWEFHCDLCGDTSEFPTEQDAIDMVVAHTCP